MSAPQPEFVTAEQVQTIVAAAVTSLAARIEELPTRLEERPVGMEERPTKRARLEAVQTVVRRTADGLFSIFDKLSVKFPMMKRDKVRRDFHAAHLELGNTVRVDMCPVVSGTRPTPCCNAEDLEKICAKIESKYASKTNTEDDTT